MRLSLEVNGMVREVIVNLHESLNTVLRERLGLVGTKRGCDTGGCGSCTVIVDGRTVYSCMTLAASVEGKKILTIEGLSEGGKLDPVQEAFVKAGALQCGYCTPGFIMSVKALLEVNPDPDEHDIRDSLVGNICRCTGYVKIFEAVKAAAESYRRR